MDPISTFKPNPDQKRRDELLGFDPLKARESGEVFTELNAAPLRRLLDEGFIDPQQRHHDSPTARGFASFLDQWPQCSVHGFVDGERTVVEGIECDLDRVPTISREALREEFAWFAGDAAEYFDEADYLFAWWG